MGQIDSDEKLDDVIRQSFTKYGPLALLPINSTQMTMIWSVDNKNLKDLSELDDDLFLEKLQLEFGGKTRKLKFSSQRFTFPLKHLTAVGFAHAPGLLRFFAVTPELMIPIIFLTQFWIFAALILSTKQILNLKSNLKSFGIVFLSFLIIAFLSISFVMSRMNTMPINHI